MKVPRIAGLKWDLVAVVAGQLWPAPASVRVLQRDSRMLLGSIM